VSWLLGAVAVVLVGAAAAALVLGAVRRTAKRHEAALPRSASWDDPGGTVLEASAARYLGTTWSPSPVRRFSGYGLLGRGIVDLGLEPGRLRVDQGRGPGGRWCVPAAVLRGVRVTSNHAGKVVYADRVLVVDWQLGQSVLSSGFVLEGEAAARDWAERVAAVAAAAEARP
jgi:hypothetical protein